MTPLVRHRRSWPRAAPTSEVTTTAVVRRDELLGPRGERIGADKALLGPLKKLRNAVQSGVGRWTDDGVPKSDKAPLATYSGWLAEVGVGPGSGSDRHLHVAVVRQKNLLLLSSRLVFDPTSRRP